MKFDKNKCTGGFVGLIEARKRKEAKEFEELLAIYARTLPMEEAIQEAKSLNPWKYDSWAKINGGAK